MDLHPLSSQRAIEIKCCTDESQMGEGLREITKGFAVMALPMKIRGGSGGPLRAIALIP